MKGSGHQNDVSPFRRIVLVVALILAFIAPLAVGLLGYHYFGPLGTLLGLGLGYAVWSAASVAGKHR